MMNRQTARRAAGFTLVEVLVVMVIIGVLGTVLIMRIVGGGREDAMVMKTRAFITTLDGTLEMYRNHPRIGVLPPTSLEDIPNFGRMNTINMGIESLVLALNSEKFDVDRVLEKFENDWENLDRDSSSKRQSYLQTLELFEIVDSWGNPYVYFNAEDYERPGMGQYLVMSLDSDEHELTTVKPWVSPKTRSFRNLSTYQLFSAGPDMKFNTEDDIGNW